MSIILVLLIIFPYVIYPLLVIILGSVFKKEIIKKDIFPTVTFMIAAYNEEDSIIEKLNNSLAIDYPSDKFEIIVVSDASSDRTDEIVKRNFPSVKLIRVEGRVGKTEARNIAIKEVTSDITVFSDATTEYNPSAIKLLVRSFADENVGMVTGHLKYKDDQGTQMGIGQKLFWKFESIIKTSQTNLGSLTGSIGCITAFRTMAYHPLPPNIIEDFTGPLFFIQNGYRVVSEPEAICYEETTKKPINEWSMRVRVIRGGMTGLIHARAVLNPLRFPVASFQLISHKVLRWLAPVFAVLLATVSIIDIIRLDDTFSWFLFIVQFLFYLSVLVAYILNSFSIRPKLLGIPLYFFIINLASLKALYKTATSQLESTWETQR
jgi:cellulose synthase/poly-beta-1,6-N-acetylglucosamine synthase-like glycosyltransferase